MKKTVPLCVLSPLPMAAAAALRGARPIRTSATSMHARKRKPWPPSNLGQTLLQSIQFAQHEYINAFGTNSWRSTIRSSFAQPSPTAEPDPKPDLLPSATPSSK